MTELHTDLWELSSHGGIGADGLVGSDTDTPLIMAEISQHPPARRQH